MRPQLGFRDLQGRRVGILGLGVEGRAARQTCEQLGINPVLVDDKADGAVPVAQGGREQLLACDVVIVSPGITPYRGIVAELDAAGVTTCGALGLWLVEQYPQRVICVTGTKGKSTTTSLVAHLANCAGVSAAAVGNIGVPPFGDDAPKADFWAVEVSASQSYWLPVAAEVNVVTSLSPDHLPWHDHRVEQYYADKLSLCTQPRAKLTVANGADPQLREQAHLLGNVEWLNDSAAPWLSKLPLLGEHNRRNALLAARALTALGVLTPDTDLNAAAASFQPLPGRLTLAASDELVDYVDDGLATNVLPVLAALDALGERPITLLLGGQERGIDYQPLAMGLANRPQVGVVTMPDNGPRIADVIREYAPQVELQEAANLAEAVRLARQATVRRASFDNRGVVLLSPAAPSFGHFVDYRDRGQAFTRLAQTTA